MWNPCNIGILELWAPKSRNSAWMDRVVLRMTSHLWPGWHQSDLFPPKPQYLYIKTTIPASPSSHGLQWSRYLLGDIFNPYLMSIVTKRRHWREGPSSLGSNPNNTKLEECSKKHYQFIDFLYFNKANTWCIIQGNQVWLAQGSHTWQSKESEGRRKIPRNRKPRDPARSWVDHRPSLASWVLGRGMGSGWLVHPPLGRLLVDNNWICHRRSQIKENFFHWSSTVTCFRHGNRRQIQFKTLR